MAAGEAHVPLLHEPAHRTTTYGGDATRRKPEKQQQQVKTNIAVSLGSGAVAGALAKTVIAPLDRTKIFFQVSHVPYSWRAAWGFIVNSVQKDGVISLWRGNSATMARIIPYAAVQFTAHERWKNVLGVAEHKDQQAHPVRHLVAGSLAGVTSQSATYPLDLARARMAVTRADKYRTLTSVFVSIVREEGVRTLYRGYPATVLGVIPYAGVSFFTYDTLKRLYKEHSGVTQTGFINVAMGGVAGALGQTASYPLDIVRRRMQTHPSTGLYSDMVNSITTIYRTERWRGFFKGLSMNWLKGPVSVGISFATYDFIKHTLSDLLAGW